MEEEIALLPIVYSEVGTIRENGFIILRLPYVSGPDQDPLKPTLDRTYVMTASQARELAQQITSRLAVMDAAIPADPLGPVH